MHHGDRKEVCRGGAGSPAPPCHRAADLRALARRTGNAAKARRGSRPAAPQDQRTASPHLFGAICPAEGKGAAIVVPRCHAAAMSLHLADIATAVAADAHAVVLLNQAGWHAAKDLVIPGNITLMPLPPRAPHFDPVENVWQVMGDNWLSNRIFLSCDAIVDHCCAAWNRLVDQPWTIISIGPRDWADAF